MDSSNKIAELWSDKLKEAGVSIHVMATGAGVGLQEMLWSVPGSSAYLSGASFPYSPEEQEELLGFMPEHFCSQEAAVDLASAAYMKAYKFGGKKAVGVGIAASVASEKLHRGDHRVWVSVMTDDKVVSLSRTFDKGVGRLIRWRDGKESDVMGLSILLDTLSILDEEYSTRTEYTDATELATQRFWARPMFLPSGQRLDPKEVKFDVDTYALMPGAFNPLHEGHLGLGSQVRSQWNKDVIFEVCTIHPIKPPLTVQQMLQRAKILQGHRTIFTQLPLYLDKARAYPGISLVVGADAMLRLLDPKWGDPEKLFAEFTQLETKFLIGSRVVDGKLITKDDIMKMIPLRYDFNSLNYYPIDGQWDISSTEIRNNKLT